MKLILFFLPLLLILASVQARLLETRGGDGGYRYGEDYEQEENEDEQELSEDGEDGGGYGGNGGGNIFIGGYDMCEGYGGPPIRLWTMQQVRKSGAEQTPHSCLVPHFVPSILLFNTINVSIYLGRKQQHVLQHCLL